MKTRFFTQLRKGMVIMYHFIINPNSRSSRGINLWKQVRAKLDEQKVDYIAHITSHSHDATAIAREITAIETKRSTIIAVLGGDGTLNEVINGITSFQNVILGYIPIGSSNDFARSLKLRTKPLEALESILNPKFYKTIDYGILSTDTTTRNFIVSGGIGYDASVCFETNLTPLKNFLNKLGLGKFIYTAIAIKQIFRYKCADAVIVLDHTKKLYVKNMLFTSIHNLQYEGGGFLFCPKADCSDDLLDICIVENMPKLKLFCILPLGFWGKHLLFKGITNYQCNHLEIISDVVLPIHTDGEPVVKQTRLTASCGNEKIRIITG